MAARAKTLVVYYSYTNNVQNIVTALTGLIDADVIRIEPAEKGLKYEANNYAIGSAQISAIRNNPDDASSYPAIDPVNVDLDKYDTVIIGAPLWWSNMAAPLQTFLFENGAKMAGKNIGLIVSSASSGISGVEADAKRLIPSGKFLSPSLWIRSSQTSNAPVTVDMHDYANMEKVGSLPQSLPRNDTYFTTGPGDLVLYLGNQFVIYYDTNTYNFTRLGKINGNYSGTQLKSILGDGNVTVTLSAGATSGIDDIAADTSAHDNAVYDLRGNLVRPSSSDINTLAPGVYIVNGRKTIVKE